MSDIAEPPAEMPTPDRRVQRTRRALGDAFNALVLAKGYDAVSAADIAARADVGRSTFYEHFQGKDDLLAHGLRRLLVPLADACVSGDPDPRLEALLAHFWQSRRMARPMMTGRTRAVMAAQLAGLIEERLAAVWPVAADGERLPDALVAVQLAQGQIGLIEAWLSGRYGVSVGVVAGSLRAGSYAMARALRVG
ncbi:MAG TPA: TetR/AcrR family transcriptional regulator [Aliidongia sp.]|nr:TetR/AcrR family transcriptional regulator [Aliidongia sp.]